MNRCRGVRVADVKTRAALQTRAALLILASLAFAAPAAQANPVWKGRTFTKVLAQGDPIPGIAGATFSNIKHFTLRNGSVHVVAGEGSNRNGLFRWRNGTLEKLVYTDTLAPTGSRFDTVHFTTDETEGAVNFSGEVFFGRPGATYGLFELRNGTITPVFTTSAPVDGYTLTGFGYPIRVGHQVVGNAQFFEGGALKNGIFRWDGAHLNKIVASGDDLPGSLGAFTGQPGSFQLAFDGTDVAFVASDHPQGRGPTGVYRTTGGSTLVKLVDGNDPIAGSGTFASSGIVFNNVDLDGAFHFVSAGGGRVSASGGNQFYTADGLRFTGGTFDPANFVFGTDGTFDMVLVPADENGPVLLDGREWTQTLDVDAQGDDVVFLVRLADGKQALYAAIATGTTPPPAPVLTVPSVAGGNLTFQFPTVAGTNYRVEFQDALGGAWSTRQTLAGTGSDLTFTEPVATGGFYRVVAVP